MKKYIAVLSLVLFVVLVSCVSDADVFHFSCDDVNSENNIDDTSNNEADYPYVMDSVLSDIEEVYKDAESEDAKDITANESDVPEIPLHNDTNTESVYPNDLIAIHDLFEPKNATIYLEGMPEAVRLYPFGEIVDTEEEGRASFVIFVETYPNMRVEQSVNLLRLIPSFDQIPDTPPVFMEIIQIQDITVADALYDIKSEIYFNLYLYVYHSHSTEDSHFNNANQGLKTQESTSNSSKDESKQPSQRANLGSALNIGFFDNPVIKRLNGLFNTRNGGRINAIPIR